MYLLERLRGELGRADVNHLATREKHDVQEHHVDVQGGLVDGHDDGPRFRYKVEKRWSTLKRWSIHAGKKVARRGHRWSQTGTAVSDGHPGLIVPFGTPSCFNFVFKFISEILRF